MMRLMLMENIRFNDVNRKIKICAILAFIFLIFSLIIIAQVPQANGYEISIYDAYPFYFWVFIISSIVTSVIIIFLAAISEKYSYWSFGILSLFIAYFIILFLPVIRGYALYWRGTGDILIHLGFVKTILISGHTSINDFYPIIHIIITNLHYIGLSLETAAFFLYIYFTFIYILFFIILGKAISKNKYVAFFLLIFALPLLFGYFQVSIHPAILSFFVIPLLLYCYHKSNINNKIKFLILLIILSFFIIFFHPITTFITILIFMVFEISRFFQTKFLNDRDERNHASYFILMLFISLSAWLLSFSVVSTSIKLVFDSLLYDIRKLLIQSQVETLTSNLALSQKISGFIILYGPIFIYFIVAFICLFIVLIYFYKRKNKNLEISYSAQFCAGILVAFIFLFGYFIEYEVIRITRYAILMAIILCGIIFSSLFINTTNRKRKKLILIFMLLIIGSSSSIAVFNIYPSPLVNSINRQLTHMELKGSEWFFESREINTPMIATDFLLSKNEIYYFGYDYDYAYKGRQVSYPIPAHFGYEKNETIAKTFEYNKIYMIITEINKRAYLALAENTREVFPYLKQDFEKLNMDSSASEIYSNGEFDVWFIS